MDFHGGNSESSKQVRVRFVTKLQARLRVPTSAIAVPANLTRMGLSEIVNLLLENGNDEHQYFPFDFLIDGELVRMPLEQFLLAKGISAEKVLEIEYIKAVVPQKQQDPCSHDDWVSAVDGSDPSFIVTGCYDNCARLWRGGESCTHILEGHGGAITSVRIINSKGIGSHESFHIASGSKDRTLRLWMFNAAEHAKHPTKVQAYKILKGHASAVQSISVAPSGDMVCSGSWDCSIKLWEVKESNTEGEIISIKKRKMESDAAFGKESQFEVEAASTLVGHTQCVSSVVWSKEESICSASWDHSIRQWDVKAGKETWNMVLNCHDIGGEGSALIAAGGSDSVLRIWDPRKPGTLAPVFQLSSHSSWITACKWHSKSWFHLISGSYDGKVMLWDLRTAWPLAVIDSHKDKVLSGDWWKEDSIISGGADSKLWISSGISIQ